MTAYRAGGAGKQADNQDDDNELDDAFRAVMEGLRTTLPGVQVLFAFLLTMPLQPGFAELDSLDRDVFYLAFASSALASVLLITPSVHQRIRAPISGLRRRTARHVFVAIRIANAGTVIAAVALSASVYLVTSLVFGDRAGAVAAGVLALVTAWAWFYLPMVAFRHR
ncbi:MAG: DUF6328 family protein [Acidimicrobiia bacterium]